jgi:hypothetical protein
MMETMVPGFWLWDVKDMGEAVARVERYPNPAPGPSEIEIRPLDDGPERKCETQSAGHWGRQ